MEDSENPSLESSRHESFYKGFIYMHKYNNLSSDDSVDIQKIYDETLDGFDVSTVICPKCGSKTLELTNRYYERNIINSPQDVYAPPRIRIAMVQCSICKSYHAVLLPCLRPFGQYTYPFIMTVLSEYYFGESNENKTRTAEKFNVQRQNVAGWIKAFEAGASGAELRRIVALADPDVRDRIMFESIEMNKAKSAEIGGYAMATLCKLALIMVFLYRFLEEHILNKKISFMVFRKKRKKCHSNLTSVIVRYHYIAAVTNLS